MDGDGGDRSKKSLLAGALEKTQKFWGGKTHRKILHFLGHFLSFVPTMLIVGMASMLSGVAVDKIREFLFFTVATISLEVCFTCLRAKYARVWATQPKGDKIALQRAWIDVAQCWVFVGAVIVSWIFVAFVEVSQMGKIQLVGWSKTMAAVLAGFNFLTAAYKMWLHAGTVVEETSMVEGVPLPAVNQPMPSPVPR